MRRLLDMLHELRIWLAWHDAMGCLDRSMARSLWRRPAELIAKRNPQQVARMENKKGLI